ncbi:MAG: LysM peptidoglycan-binding domain-containing protein [bacterium]|nr:LysM peptidoglycan-binding domain-containing protein [bacterium]
MIRGAAILLLLLVAVMLVVPATAGALNPELFPVPEKLDSNVEFWTQVYTGYDSHHTLLHDERYMYVVYAVLDFTALDASEASAGRKSLQRRQEIRKAESKYRSLLQNLASGRASKHHAEDQARVEKMFEAVPGGRSKYSAAAGRMRTQRCLKDVFAEAIERSGYYMDEIEDVFRGRGLPVELTRLPFVESMFQWNARSSASAGGIWQFVPSSARLYRLEMDMEVDERYDPLRATDAAARHLEDNYESLQTWPLAITAYNHGLGGMRRAVRRVGTRDMGEISARYRSRYFGFASRNFYAEFVAAARVYERREHYFPGVEPFPALAADEFRPERYVPIRELAKGAGTELDNLKTMNPALSSSVWAGHVYLPASYALQVPAGRAVAFEASYAALSDRHKSPHQVGYYYRVRRGDTLGRIADKFGTSTSKLQRANKLSSPHRIRVGQRLLIPPGSRGGGSAVSVVAQSNGGVHVVRRGETLSGIADAYGTSTSALRAANGLRSANRIYVGQRISVAKSTGGSSKSAGGDRKTHVVRSGETLHSIAQRYGTTVRAIQSANRIRDHIIQPAQVLIIP